MNVCQNPQVCWRRKKSQKLVSCFIYPGNITSFFFKLSQPPRRNEGREHIENFLPTQQRENERWTQGASLAHREPHSLGQKNKAVIPNIFLLLCYFFCNTLSFGPGKGKFSLLLFLKVSFFLDWEKKQI